MMNLMFEQEFRDIKPLVKHNIMELVSQVGIDTSDWKNFKGAYAASNPKYCYNWSFEDPVENIIAVNLWYERLELTDNLILCKFNAREINGDNVRKQRVEKLDKSIYRAFSNNIPLRVILLGKKEGSTAPDFRTLDTKYWYVHSYDKDGNCKIVRDNSVHVFVDQFDIDEMNQEPPSKITSTVTKYPRSKVVREQALLRANGRCEYCNKEGFKTKSGSLYLESHHIKPLSEKGLDTLDNVIALCPNHHKEAHYSQRANELRKEFVKKIDGKILWVSSLARK